MTERFAQTVLDGYLQKGELGEAIAYLKRIQDDDGVVIPRLIHLLIRQGSYEEAFDLSLKLTNSLGIRRCADFFVLMYAYLVILAFMGRLNMITRWLRRGGIWLFRLQRVNWEQSYAVLWGFYWQDIHLATLFNLHSWLTAVGTVECERSIAFLCYTLALRGRKFLGLRGLARALQNASERKDSTMERDLLVWYGVALQWSSRHDDSEAIHNRFEREFSDAEPFLKIICHASRLHSCFSEKGPQATEIALNRCFEVSLSLRLSRNHIQIFSAKAALLALENRVTEMEFYLQKSHEAALRNSNNLDWVIHYRMRAVAELNANQVREAAKSTQLAKNYLANYGRIPWYSHELDRLKWLIYLRGRNGFLHRVRAGCLHLLYSMSFFSYHRMLKGYRTSIGFLSEDRPIFWNAWDCTHYLQSRLSGARQDHEMADVEEVLTLFTEKLLDHSWTTKDEPPEREELFSKIEMIFPNSQIFSGKTVFDCLNNAARRVKEKPLSSVLFNDRSTKISVPYEQSRFMVAMTVEGSPDQEFAIGVYTNRCSILKKNIIEVGLAIIIDDYVKTRKMLKAKLESIKFREAEAIAKTTQMLAHDVRKPFTQLTVALDLIKEAKTPKEMGKLIDLIIPDLEKSINSVNGLIEDVMEVSRKTNLYLETVPIEDFLNGILRECIHIHGAKNLQLSYDFQHAMDPAFDLKRTRRVFANIITNAIQSATPGSRIWVNTRNTGNRVQFILGNSGSAVPEKNRKQLFDTFFTAGKQGGTGLGLAIAKKIVNQHGGEIRCQSDVEQQTVEFIFDLPASQEPRSPPPILLYSQAIEYMNEAKALKMALRHDEKTLVDDPREILFETKIAQASQQKGRKFRLAVADDDRIYREGIEQIVKRHASLSQVIEITHFEEGHSLLGAAFDFDFVICDVDFGPGLLSGFDVLQKLSEGPSEGRPPICIHSNRSLREDHEKAFGLGASLVLPKPMSRAHLLYFMATHIVNFPEVP